MPLLKQKGSFQNWKLPCIRIRYLSRRALDQLSRAASVIGQGSRPSALHDPFHTSMNSIAASSGEAGSPRSGKSWAVSGHGSRSRAPQASFQLARKLSIAICRGSTVGSGVAVGMGVAVAVGTGVGVGVGTGVAVGGIGVGVDTMVRVRVTAGSSSPLQAMAKERTARMGNNSNSFGFHSRRWSINSPPSFSSGPWPACTYRETPGSLCLNVLTK